MSELCPCGSGLEFDACCGPILDGARPAPTAEALMRARYTAYARNRIDFLYDSSSDAVRADFDADASRNWAESASWTGMEIVAREQGGENDAEGIVEFIARYEMNGVPYEHHERSFFTRVGGAWRFTDGVLVKPEPVRRATPKIGRNDPCPCGSGKKYKKCCGR